MVRRIEETIYRLTYTATWHDYVECSSKEDLFKYVAQEVVNGQIVTSVNEMCKDGSTPKVRVHTDKEFKRILAKYQNFAYATQQLMKFNYHVEFTITNHARIYYKDKSGDFTELSPCDETRHGYVTIEGKVQNIDEWLNRRI